MQSRKNSIHDALYGLSNYLQEYPGVEDPQVDGREGTQGPDGKVLPVSALVPAAVLLA